LLPHISSTKPRTDLSWQCQRNNYQIFRSANLPEAVKSVKLKKQEQHLLLVQSERSVYQKMVADCKTSCQDLQLSLGGPTEPAYHGSFSYMIWMLWPFKLLKNIYTVIYIIIYILYYYIIYQSNILTHFLIQGLYFICTIFYIVE
jgi:hypothetical protein